MSEKKSNLNFQELLLAHLDGSITPEQQQELKCLLREDADMRKYYTECIILYASLKRYCSASLPVDQMNQDEILDAQTWEILARMEDSGVAIEIPKEQPQQELIQKVEHPNTKRNANKTSRIIGLLSIAAMLLFIMTVQFLPSRAPKPVASLVRSFNAVWSNSDGLMEKGTRLWNDDQRYCLDQGLAEIVFDNGVKVLIEAPSEFRFLDENEMEFKGSLTARVPNSAHGFTVNTDNSKVVDLGTEFGLRAMDESKTEVYVTKGIVEIRSTGTSRKSRIRQLVRAGEGYAINKLGIISKISFRKNVFSWKRPSPYERAVYKTDPLCYWRFDRDQQSLLRDEMNPRVNDQYRLFGSPGYSDGPDLGGGKNFALRLTGREEDYAILRDFTNEADNADGFAIAMWVRPEKAYSAFKNNIIMRYKAVNIEGVGGSQMNLGFDDKNRFYFHTFSNNDTVPKERGGRISIRSNPAAVNKWHHVVVTYTKNDQVSIYVNGQLQATEELLGSFKPAANTQWCLGSAHIESQYSKSHTSFTGSIDEICHYGRELSAEEVRTLYEAVGQK